MTADQGKPSVCPSCCGGTGELCPQCKLRPRNSSPVPAATRRDGHSKLVWNKENQKIETVSAPQAESVPRKPRIADLEAAIAEGKHLDIQPDGTTFVSDHPPRPTIDVLLSQIEAESVPAGKDAAREWTFKRSDFSQFGEYVLESTDGYAIRFKDDSELINLAKGHIQHVTLKEFTELKVAASETAALRAERDAWKKLATEAINYKYPPPIFLNPQLQDRVAELEREIKELRDNAEIILSRFGVRSGECNTCDLRHGKHSADCPIPRIEAVLRAQRCPMCGETDPSKNEVNCPAKWHRE